MKLTKESIMARTHDGLQIYAYILKQYYPREALYFSNNQCRPARNPYNANKRTLSIQMENGMACHHDMELINFKGTAFDFANKHFKMATLEELYYMINQVMDLNLKIEVEDQLEWLNFEDDSWRPRISFYKAPIRNVFPSAELSLAEIHSRIIGKEFEGITALLRGLNDPKEKRIFKANNFPYVTFSGTFKSRNDDAIKQHSQLMVFDFDHLKNVEKVRRALMNDEFFDTEMLFISPSGDGLKWIIRFDDQKMTHRNFFLAVSNYLNRTYHLDTDTSGKDISRACFLPHDPTAYLHPRHRKL